MERQESFTETAVREGLATSGRTPGAESFRLPLGDESVSVSSDPESVFGLLKLARQHAESETSGPHIAILNLVARRRDIEQRETGPWGEVDWYPAQPVDEPPGALVSMRTWLAEQGFDVEAIMTDQEV